ncbi:MAG: hypothetical protein JXR07_17800 [Reichenbachiella sp.]
MITKQKLENQGLITYWFVNRNQSGEFVILLKGVIYIFTESVAAMRKTIFILYTTIAFSLPLFQVSAQSESFDLAEKAYQENRSLAALKLFQKAVLHEKFDMRGKDIPQAYAYMALIRNEYLEKKLENGTFQTIQQNPGLLKTAISDINTAIEYHDKSANSLIQKASRKLIKNATKVGEIVIDSLLKHDFENHSPEVLEIAALLNFELKDLSSIESDNWYLHDILGFTHYMLDEMDLAMLEFKRGRDIYNDTKETELSPLHLQNCSISTKYLYKDTQNYIEAYSAANDGKNFVLQMMQASESDDINEIRKLSALESTFSSIQTRIENVNSISSNKE